MRTLALDAIAKAVPGSIGVILATIALEAMNSMSSDRASRSVFYEALGSIASDRNSPEREKKIAAFASSLSSNYMSDGDNVMVRKAAAAAIASRGTEPSHVTIAGIALDCCPHLTGCPGSSPRS